MFEGPRRTVALGAAAAAVVLPLAAPLPATAVRTLRDAGSAADPTAPLVALVALSAWLLAAWLLLTVLVTAGTHLPGAGGRLLAPVARRVAPAAVRRAIEVALGLTVAVGVLGATPAAAAAGTPPTAAGDALTTRDLGAPVGGAPPLDWPAGPPAPPASSPPATALDWPGTTPAASTEPAASTASATSTEPSASTEPAASTASALDTASALSTEPAAPGGPGTADPVVVQPGDSLWALAEQGLAARGHADPSDAEVAQAWPAWWSANREVVGDDPDLLHPGTTLLPPPDDGPPPSAR